MYIQICDMCGKDISGDDKRYKLRITVDNDESQIFSTVNNDAMQREFCDKCVCDIRQLIRENTPIYDKYINIKENV